MRGEVYQYFLIMLGVCATALFGAFLFRELYPEYKIYQEDYVALEEFRSTYTGAPVPPFRYGIKQIVIADKNKGPEVIDRCTSCHITLEFEHFSPTKIAYDINGNMEIDVDGFPVQVPNPNYIWHKLDESIASLRNEEVNAALLREGKGAEAQKRLNLADKYESYKTAQVGGETFDVTKVLRMHPLIGRETRPFEYHPLDDYGCTSCHSGNGRGLTSQKAHGPVFDGQYEVEFMGPTPQFLEKDVNNDPQFAHIFNNKPGHALLFQTTPVLIGSLMQAKCVQCHKTGVGILEEAYSIADQSTTRRKEKSNAIKIAYNNEVAALVSLINLQKSIQSKGVAKTLETLEEKEQDLFLSEEEMKSTKQQVLFVRKNQNSAKSIESQIKRQIFEIIGSEELISKLNALTQKNEISPALINTFINDNRLNANAKGTLFAKADAKNLEQEMLFHLEDTDQSFSKIISNPNVTNAMVNDVDLMTNSFENGKQLFVSQACYACHRIAGFSRGGIGPELTEEGKKYPWFIKESIVWPQADLKTSTMPNFKLDHVELEGLMTFLLAQTGETKAEAETTYKIALQNWEAGKKVTWEQPISPSKMQDLDFAMNVFATEGCAACHRLKGFTSNVGFAIEKSKEEVPFKNLYDERAWFSKIFPEEIAGSEIVETIEKFQNELETRIVDDVRKDSILEKIEAKTPDAVISLYSNFRYASRAKNHEYETRIKEEKDPAKRKELKSQLEAWKNLVWRVLMMYVQEYGLGRLIGPRPNWAGVYRTDEWLMEHFRSPSSHIARSIMPVFPFDDSKFYSLTHMLDVLGIRNRDEVRQIWQHRGFNPQEAYQIFCSQCHGAFMQGNGPVSDWIYPIPKSLRNADFLRNLTKANVYKSIIHGVKGTPMPPWGEIGDDKDIKDPTPVITATEAKQLVDWIFSSLPGSQVIRGNKDVPKWQYTPKDVLEEIKKEGGKLEPKTNLQNQEKKATPSELTALPTGNDYFASTKPVVYTKKQESNVEVDKYFNIIPQPDDKEDENAYYIKKSYYTPQNLMAGRAFFELNCAVCHGRDADGSGNRAGSMIDAKPRMLTNLDWLETRDDLRLLRSIKYGIPGTAMVAWGDQTSSLQRMQLVMYIRTISEKAQLSDKLLSMLYKAFDKTEISIEKVRIYIQPQLKEAKLELEKVSEKQFNLNKLFEKGEGSQKDALEAYQKLLILTDKLNNFEDIDELAQKLIQEIKSEKKILQDVGFSMIAQKDNGINPQNFNDLICLKCDPYTFKNGVLSMKETPEDKVESAIKEIDDNIDKSISSLKSELTLVKGKIKSPSREEEIKHIETKLDQLKKLQQKLTTSLYKAKQSRERQKELVNTLNKKMTDLKKQPKQDRAE